MHGVAVTDVDQVLWDLEPLLAGGDVEVLLGQAEGLASAAQAMRGRIAELDAAGLAELMHSMAKLQDVLGRAGSYASLRYAADTADPANGALMQHVQERATAIGTELIFVELEWAAVPDERVDELLADERLAFCRHHLRSALRYRPHLLTEPEERIDTEKSVTGQSAWVRLFEDLTSSLTCDLDDGEGGAASVPLAQALALLQSADREVRAEAAAAVTAGLAPGLRTRAFIYNTLLHERSVEDRLRGYPSWISARNLDNEASDASVEALIEAVVGRYDLPQRWYRLKARLLGLDRLADYDRLASVSGDTPSFSWDDGRALVLDAYHSFSGELGRTVEQFFDEPWIHAPVRPGKRNGAFCAYTVPSHHPYLLLNWTDKRTDVLTLAHELGHGLHGYLAAGQGVFHQTTPLTLAETASVFGETVTFNRLLAQTSAPGDRLSLLAGQVEGAIATVFRQVAMNRFEHAAHRARRTSGELSVDDFNELWASTQTQLLADAVEVTDGYRSWWSYIGHFIAVPGYVYAYAYGQLLALAIYRRYEEVGEAFVPRYLELLRAGGSLPPAELGRIVGCDLDDPTFWDGGLRIIEAQVEAAEQAAQAAGRV